MTCPFGFLVVLPDQMLLIPVDSHFSWLTMFYMLPKELVEKRPEYLNLPRNIRDIAYNEEYMKIIRDDSFTEFVWSCYAYANWHFFLLPTGDGLYRPFSGKPMQYSGNFPFWRLTYLAQPYQRMKLENDWGCSFQRLFLMDLDEELDWVTLDDFNFIFRAMFDQVVMEQKWQPIIDDSWNHRQPEDFKGTGSQSRDFMRKWTHSRTAQNVSLEQIRESGTVVGNDALYDIPDPSAEFETKVLDKMKMEDFKKRLSDTDLKILELRAQGYTQQEIAMTAVFGSNMKDGSIGKISENRFARADLEHQLLMVDDDMKMEALKQTNYVKSIVTAQGKRDFDGKNGTIESSPAEECWKRFFWNRCF